MLESQRWSLRHSVEAGDAVIETVQIQDRANVICGDHSRIVITEGIGH